MHRIRVSALRELRWPELLEAAQLLGRGMCDNPANVRAFGPDTERRRGALTRFFLPVLRGLYRRGLILGAFSDGRLVGVSGMARPGFCQPTPREKLALIPSLVFGNPLWTPMRILRWVGEWERRDPAAPHWHLGPVAVDSHLQGRGLGSSLLAAFCGRMDDCHALSYLETDTPENVRFYERFGFRVVADAKVLDVPNWFMSRPARVAEKECSVMTSTEIAETFPIKASDHSETIVRCHLDV